MLRLPRRGSKYDCFKFYRKRKTKNGDSPPLFRKDKNINVSKNKKVFKNKNSLLILEDKLKQLIDFEWILLILLSLISLEWLVRKYNGLI